MELNFYSCSYTQLTEYVDQHNLTAKEEGMHTYWYDSNGNIKAQRMHGFASDMYSIAEDPNFETLNYISKLIHRR